MIPKPKTFSFHWGSGYVAEEAQIRTPHTLPTLQLLRYTEGDAAGEITIRFCHYSPNGHFRRSPLLMSAEDMDMMRDALQETPELRDLLVRLVLE